MHISLLALTGLAIITSSPSLMLAQAQPQPCGGAAFAKVGSTFYIQGGATFQDNLIQAFWALDLSTPWTTSSPAWSSISPPGPYNAFHSAGVASDGSSFITFGRDTAAAPNQVAPNWINTFNIGSKSWSAASPLTVADTSRRDFYAVSNLAGSKIYIMGGNAGDSGSASSNVLNTYDPATGSMIETLMPSSAPQNSSTYAAVWVKRSATMLLIGGINAGGSLLQSLWSYNPISGGWATQSSSGPFTHGRIEHCAASNADGSLVAVFGGFVGGLSTADPNVYILNTTTWTWTAIPLASGRGRGNAACTIVDDTFIIWGGFYNRPSVQGGLPSGPDNLLLLSLSTQQWKTSYSPSMASGGAGNGGSGGDGGNGTGTGGLSGAAIGGICAGVAVVIAAVAFLLFRRTWKKGDGAKATSSSSKLESGSPAAAAHPHPPAPPCSGGGGAAEPKAGGYIPSNHHSPQPPLSSTDVSPTVYDQSLYHQQQYPEPQPIGYTGYEQHFHQQQQQQYPPYLQPAPDHTFHHRPSTEVAYSNAGGALPDGAQYVDENGHVYRRSYQPEVVAATPPAPSPGTVYYPPPPPSGASVGTPEQGAYQVAYGQGGEEPYKASIGEGGRASNVDSSPYHDSYGVAGSATTAGAMTGGAAGVKRPVGGPQGGPYVEVPVAKGAPQAILQ